jgi:hypothetical protein
MAGMLPNMAENTPDFTYTKLFIYLCPSPST